MPIRLTRNRCSLWALLFFLLPVAGRLSADMINTGGGGVIPDNNATGFASTINIAVNEVITNLSVSINFGTLGGGVRGHTYVGDLRATLTGPGGSIVLFDRPGVPASTFGDSSNLSGIYRWSDTGGNFSTAAQAVNNNSVVANGNYRAQAANDSFLSFATTFAGSSTAGTWTLRLTDLASSDTGGFLSWTLDIQSSPAAVPEPSAALCLVTTLLGAVWATSRSRRREARTRKRLRYRVYY